MSMPSSGSKRYKRSGASNAFRRCRGLLCSSSVSVAGSSAVGWDGTGGGVQGALPPSAPADPTTDANADSAASPVKHRTVRHEKAPGQDGGKGHEKATGQHGAKGHDKATG